MVQLQGVARLGRAKWLLPAASAAVNETTSQLEFIRASSIASDRSYNTEAKASAAMSGFANGRAAQLLGAGTALAVVAMLFPDLASAKREIAILPGSKPPPPPATPIPKPAPLAETSSTAPATPAAVITPANEKDTASHQNRDAKGRPIYMREEVAKHRTPQDRIWVTYKDGVYDITEFVEMHPGGVGKIMLAAGGSVEPFWALYQQHRKAEVVELLEPYRIGSLEGGAPATAATEDPYAADPARHPSFIARTERPYNGETPVSLLAVNPITPNDIFFVRNHLPVPHVDPASYRLKVEGEGARSLELSLEDLRSRFRKHTVTATIQCSGNRRSEMSRVKAVKGLAWDQGAIGTAVWGGVRLRDVLKAAGLHEDDPHVRHIQFEGYDVDPVSGEIYGASIPLHKALSLYDDVLLAYEMNGQLLSADHGAPLRVVVPGVTGARSVKWLRRIVPSASESTSHWQQRDYKAFSPSVDWDSVDWAAAPALQEPPVTSAICEPTPGTSVSVSEGEVTVRGYAWSGGGRGIIRVDVSPDGGATWAPARLLAPPPGAPEHGSYSGAWAWTLWEATLPLPPPAADGSLAPTLELVCKAVDSSYNNQPDSISPIWNLRGIVNNAWHRVSLSLQP